MQFQIHPLRKISLALLFGLLASLNSLAQDPMDFFPHQVGDLWQYQYLYDDGFSEVETWEITRDSIGANGRVFLSYNHQSRWTAVLDTLFQLREPLFYSEDTLLVYKLDADTCDFWIHDPRFPTYSWVFEAENNIKKFRYGPIEPDSCGSDYYLTERHLVSGIGLVWEWMEPGFVKYLTGAVINGDTIGVIVGIEENHLSIPSELALSQNYPNPFNATTLFEVFLPQSTVITLKLYNSLGREVSAIYRGRKPAGNHTFTVDGSDLPSGVYFIRVQADGFAETRRAILIK